MPIEPKLINIDFDGTCVTQAFPEVGEDIGAVPVLKALVENGHKLILWTCRGDNYLDDAVAWFIENDIPLYGVNQNPDQTDWSSSPKSYAHLTIDDTALGAPLKWRPDLTRPFIDWDLTMRQLYSLGYLTSLQLYEMIKPPCATHEIPEAIPYNEPPKCGPSCACEQ